MNQPQYILVGAANYAMMQALVKFTGRDRRRIKREMRKAWQKARRTEERQ